MSERADKISQNPAPADPATDRAWRDWREREISEARRLRALELAVQMIGKQAGRTFSLLDEADKLVAWMERSAPPRPPVEP